MDSLARRLKHNRGLCNTCKHLNRIRSLCIECNASYMLRDNAKWERVGWEPNETLSEIMERERIENKDW